MLAEKNLLSDAAAGGAITSVPEVLGTQIARVEKYGISFNPESYVHWGPNRYFTDVKRGVVVNIMGDSMSQDSLSIVSDLGMRTWFRDEFNKSFNTQKLGAYDPYMNEYVLSTNNIKIPVKSECLACGVTQALSFDSPTETQANYEFCVNLGQYVGDTTINWANLVGASGITLEYIYNGDTTIEPITTTSGSITFPKNSINEQNVTIILTYDIAFSIELTVNCPDAQLVNVVQVVLANNADAGDTTHIQYRYDYLAYSSSLQSTPVTLISGTTPPVVSYYNSISGYEGASNIPPSGSTVRIQSAQIVPDSFAFNPLNDKFKYLKTNTLYPNTTSGINALLAAASLATPISGSGGTYYADFTLSGTGSYIYLIWDFRDAIPVDLCYTPSETTAPQKEVCCNCLNCGESPCITIVVDNPTESNAAIFFPFGDDNCGGESSSFELTVLPGTPQTLCINNVVGESLWQILSGEPTITIVNCACGRAPINATPPLLTFTRLYPGDVITTSNGTWT